MTIPKNLSLVILDNFHMLNDNPNVRTLFINTLWLKSLAYATFFGKRYVPYDSLDFISKYYILCNNGTPICTVRMTSFKKAFDSNLDISLYRYAKESNTERHMRKMNEYMAKGDCIYSGSFTIHPDYKSDEVSKVCKLMVSAACFLEISENKNAIFACGTIRMKVDQMMKTWGFHEIVDEEGVLPTLIKKESDNEKIRLMIMNEPSENGKSALRDIESIILEKHRFSLGTELKKIA